MKNSESTSKTLYDLLVSRNFDPDILDSRGQSITDVNQGEIFSFDFVSDGKNYGTVVITLSGDNQFEVYYGDNLGRGMDKEHRSDWYKFLQHLKSFAARNMMQFNLRDFTKLKHSMRTINSVNESVFEGYYGGKRTSYNKAAEGAKLKIRHSKKLEDSDPRYRFVQELFVETPSGERFKLPFKNLNAGKAMARHVSEGGTPYDSFGQHIHSMVKEMNSITHFVRKHSRNLEEDVVNLVDDAKSRRHSIKKTMKSLTSKRGYAKYHESWNPEDTGSMVERMETFEANYAPIEDAVQVFENWIVAESLSTIQKRELGKLVDQGLRAGVDGLEANSELDAIIQDEELDDLVAKVGDRDPEANVFDDPAVRGRLEELGLIAIKEINDTDTGTRTLKAARDPMLEDILKLL